MIIEVSDPPRTQHVYVRVGVSVEFCHCRNWLQIKDIFYAPMSQCCCNHKLHLVAAECGKPSASMQSCECSLTQLFPNWKISPYLRFGDNCIILHFPITLFGDNGHQHKRRRNRLQKQKLDRSSNHSLHYPKLDQKKGFWLYNHFRYCKVGAAKRRNLSSYFSKFCLDRSSL